jgi:hypothetical protein
MTQASEAGETAEIGEITEIIKRSNRFCHLVEMTVG